MLTFPEPQFGASLLLSFSPATSNSSEPAPSVLLLGPSRLSALRTFAALEAGYQVVVGGPSPSSPSSSASSSQSTIWDPELLHRLDSKQITSIPFDLSNDASTSDWSNWFEASSSLLEGVTLIGLSDTLVSSETSRRTLDSAIAFRREARRRRFVINVADRPELSDFSWMVSHRFDLVYPSSSTSSSTTTNGTMKKGDERPRKSPLQLALTTNSSACRLATRLRREIVSSLPKSVGAAVLAVSELRKELKREQESEKDENDEIGEGDSEETEGVGLNRPVEQLTREKSRLLEELAIARSNGRSTPSTSDWTASTAQLTRMRYVAQLSEYWPLDRLATVTLASISAPSSPLATPRPSSPSLSSDPFNSVSNDAPTSSHHSLDVTPFSARPQKRGRILLLGAGTGSTLLLTRLAHLLLTCSDPSSPYYVDLFLSDKLVPSQILDLIPPSRRSGVVIARKYPGNAEAAQDELMALAVEGAQAGKTVLRMKQGDPFLYGRGGEEVLHFRRHGFESVVIPGLSSCLAGPTIAGIPVTQRGVAESLVVCTGVGRGGRIVQVAGYERGKTLCVLMGVARLRSLVESLLEHPTSKYPPYLPIALIERASSPDQRVVASTIEQLADVLDNLPPHRPPGMIVVGWAVMCLDGEGDMTVLDDPEDEGREQRDRERVVKWNGTTRYRVREGLGEDWRSVVEVIEAEDKKKLEEVEGFH
ncbi:uroporphyrinogen-III C-methyltransferase [Sporobolomyces salmoneus]|uniref:uroporphyrinogen-III C-methyltransferase n=1 Tax=Sporobolomyces salmoneus TaxID=183962 RepID=UPI00317A44AF